jgi:UDP-N-acetylglucosamine--N-acetylmuramyl-(pentapeptide) pyrophosphoryl-undecaprenol N-acetylglucosamine transferase
MLIAGGGTGGHLFPGIALAQEVTTRHPQNDVLFVGTSRGLEARVVPAAGYKLELIDAAALKGMGLWRALIGLFRVPLAMWQSRKILRRYQPDVVVGVGGYASGPAVLMAWLMRVPTCVQEQNALPGLTNRVLGRFVDAVFISFPEAKREFPSSRTRLLGNPIRRELMDNFLRAKAQHPKFQLLVFGGSQGAHTINTTVPAAAALLKDLQEQVAIIHQTGKKDTEAVKEAYKATAVEVQVVEFIDDMSKAYAYADLVICRAGATTLAELTVCKKPSILIPFPFAADNHQEINARSLAEAGAAVMLREAELTPEKLAETIRDLFQNRDKLLKMEKAAGLMGRPEAAKEIADVCVELMQARWGKDGRAGPLPPPPKQPKPEKKPSA